MPAWRINAHRAPRIWTLLAAFRKAGWWVALGCLETDAPQPEGAALAGDGLHAEEALHQAGVSRILQGLDEIQAFLAEAGRRLDWVLLSGSAAAIPLMPLARSCSPTVRIAYDLGAFSQFMGLPQADLTIIGTPTESNFSTDAHAGWASETTLDVEWVHAIAPGAKIVLVVAPTNSFTDLFSGVVQAASIPGVVSISNSWSGFDIEIVGASEFYSAADNIFKAIGAAGQSIQFSTGDYGDNASQLGGFYTSTGWPSSSPYVTGIGGVSVVLDSQKHISWQTSWGTNLTEIADTVSLGSPPINPNNNEGFVFGGTGGASDTYPKPAYQNSLLGNRRLTPDISWVADPYTGVEIIYSVDAQNDLGIDVVGGTSASCPMFSALWAIATQHAHHPLGQAAPRLYRLQPGAITDVENSSSRNNVTGMIHDAGGSFSIRSSELAAPLNNLPSFISVLYNSPFSTRWFVLSFGLDSTLPTGRGWDPATGLGTPNGWNFVHALSHSQD
jgi:subtilase family serine protease